MHKILIAATAFTAAALGVALAQDGQGRGGRLAAMFAMADTNHDGAVSRAEFDAARAARFEQLDADHNGVLSASEMPHWGGPQAAASGHGVRGDANNDGSVSRAEWDAESARMFARLDTNNDGSISPAEQQAAEERMQSMHR
jgi:Ca2+-binding EF-hand superfamily protein